MDYSAVTDGQGLSFVSMLLYVQRGQYGILRTDEQGLSFVSMLLYVHRRPVRIIRGLTGRAGFDKEGWYF